MAEVLGIVASGLAVQQTAGQLTKSLFRLRQLWEQIQIAPEQIQDLMADLASFTALLTHMEGQLDEDSPMAHQSAQLCRNALAQLDAVVTALQLQVTSPKQPKRFVGALKAVIRREDLQRFEDRLERAFRLLQMSHQCYISASTRALPEVIAQRMSIEFQRYQQENAKAMVRDSEGERGPQEEDINMEVGEGRAMRPKTRRTRLDKICSIFGEAFVLRSSSNAASFEIAFRPPILRRIWTIQATRVYGGWKCVFRQGGYLTQKVRDVIYLDDDRGLLRLFQLGEGSPYDRLEDGFSMFQHATMTRKFRVMSMLLKSGYVEDGEVEPPMVASIPYNALCFWVGLSGYGSDQIRLLNDLGYQLDGEQSVGSADLDYTFLAASILNGEVFKVWQRLYFPRYHELPISTRWLIGRLIVTRSCDLGAVGRETILPQTEVFKSSISTEWNTTSVDSLIVQSVDDGLSLLGSVAYALGWVSAPARNEPRLLSQPRKINLQNWGLLAREIMSKEPMLLHPIEHYRIWSRLFWLGSVDLETTPLWAMLIGAFIAGYRNRVFDNDARYGTRPRPKFWDNTNFALELWLNTLCSCGIDLMEYGRAERNLVSKDKVTRDLEINLMSRFGLSDGLVGWMRIISIDIGPRPEDWRIWWAFEYEIYAGEFWEMVQETASELAMPGGWVD